MPAQRKKCSRDGCTKKFWATRSDSKWCSEKCKYAERTENAKFEISEIPKSGVKGVTFHRIMKRWVAKYNNNYLGSFKTMEEAIEMRRKVE